MANPHFGKLADVWKHAVLLEVLTRQPPAGYAETHAGSARYRLVADDERRFGVLKFLDAARGNTVLARSAYCRTVTPFADAATYPGSALLAMTVLRDSARYLLCDTDPVSATGLRSAAAGLGLTHCSVAESDGVATVARWCSGDDRPRATVVHVDPFDGPSAVSFAADIAERGHRLVFWYGYDRPDERAWAHNELADRTGTPLWCGDIMIVDAEGAGTHGDLGVATTPGTGFGVVLANVDPGTISVCTDVGNALSDAYHETTLPGGGSGHVLFTTRVHRPAGRR